MPPMPGGIPFCIPSQNRHGNTQQPFCAILAYLMAVPCTLRNWHDHHRLASHPTRNSARKSDKSRDGGRTASGRDATPWWGHLEELPLPRLSHVKVSRCCIVKALRLLL